MQRIDPIKPQQPALPPARPDIPSRQRSMNVQGIGDFKPFISKRLQLPVTFRYPKNWVAGEELGRSRAYQQVIILGPRNSKDTYNAGLTVRSMPTQQAGGRFADIQSLVDYRLTQQQRTSAFELLEQHPAEHIGLQGMELIFVSEAMLTGKRSLKNVATRIKTRTVIFENNLQLIELIYSADEQDYDSYASAFSALLESTHLAR